MSVQMATRTVGVMHWGQRTLLKERFKMSAWYDHTFYRVPVTGPVDVGRMHTALHARYTRSGNFGSAAGGFTSVSSIEDNGDGSVTVEVLYHIGD